MSTNELNSSRTLDRRKFCELLGGGSLIGPLALLSQQERWKWQDRWTGCWRADDGGMYFARLIDNVFWWAGISSDNGESYTNVFHGIYKGLYSVGDPAYYGTVEGQWADVPRGRNAQHGTLRVSLEFTNDLQKRGQSGGFGPESWMKEKDGSLSYEPGIIQPFYTEAGLLTGVWASSNPPRTYYFRQVGNVVWWLGLYETFGYWAADVFRGIFRGDRISGDFAAIPWAKTRSAYAGQLSIVVSADDPYLRAVLGSSDPPYKRTNWIKIQ